LNEEREAADWTREELMAVLSERIKDKPQPATAILH
jgi:hypothetical protein